MAFKKCTKCFIITFLIFMFIVGGVIMNMKTCAKCGVKKQLKEFWEHKNTADGFRSSCKDCVSKQGKVWMLNNIDKVRRLRRQNYVDNKERDNKRNKEYGAKHRAHLKATGARWRKKNRIKIKEHAHDYNQRRDVKDRINAKYNYRRKHDIKFRLDMNMKARIRKVVRDKSGRSWKKLLGYTVVELKIHLEKLFKSGMTWGNYGKHWHIDHKKPKKLFRYRSCKSKQFKACWALSNLQPLEAFENDSKGAKYV